MRGKIIKGIAGFYYVHAEDGSIYECKAKGLFRMQKIKPLVGDNVEFHVLDEKEKKGNVVDIYPRTNELIRPAVSNVDQALIIFAAASPEPNLNLLDRFLIMMEKQNVNTIICFNKKDIVSESELDILKESYLACGYQVLFTSAADKEGIDFLGSHLRGKTTVVAGPSGVGKSSIINILQPDAEMETGEVSVKIQRGKHTTRHSELICVSERTYIMDTPGFSSLYIESFEKEDLKAYFPEFQKYEGTCRFQGCSHVNEPSCSVKAALEAKHISRVRYDNYILLFNELKDRKKY